MLLSMLVRPDAIILCVFLCLAWLLIRPGEYRRPLLGMALCITLYLGVTRIVGAYSWLTLMYHAYINYLPHPRTHPYAVHAADLLRIYLKFGQPLFSQSFLTMLLMAVLALLAALATAPLRSPQTALATVIVVTLPLHFLVHPSDNLRVRGAYYIAAFIFLLIAISNAAAISAAPNVRRWLLPRRSDGPPADVMTGLAAADLHGSHS